MSVHPYLPLNKMQLIVYSSMKCKKIPLGMLDLLVPSAAGIYCWPTRSGACRYLLVVTTGYIPKRKLISAIQTMQANFLFMVNWPDRIWPVWANLVCLKHWRFSLRLNASLCTRAWGSEVFSEWVLTYNFPAKSGLRLDVAKNASESFMTVACLMLCVCFNCCWNKTPVLSGQQHRLTSD